MYEYRISKYNPDNRDASGVYLGDDWTDVSSIGESFNGSVLTVPSYVDTENKFLLAVEALWNLNSVSSMKVLDIETSGPRDLALALDGFEDTILEITSNATVVRENLNVLVRACLRGMFWCRLVCSNEPKVFIHFGSYLYMYFGSLVEIRPEDVPAEIYVEKYISPYHPHDFSAWDG